MHTWMVQQVRSPFALANANGEQVHHASQKDTDWPQCTEMTDWPTTPYTCLNMPSCTDTATGTFTTSQHMESYIYEHTKYTHVHVSMGVIYSSRTLPIYISGNCWHSSMFHCSYVYMYIHKWSLVVCRFRYCTQLSQTSCVHLIHSVCESFVCLFMAPASALHVFIAPASVVCTSAMNTLIAQWISCMSLLCSICGNLVYNAVYIRLVPIHSLYILIFVVHRHNIHIQCACPPYSWSVSRMWKTRWNVMLLYTTYVPSIPPV